MVAILEDDQTESKKQKLTLSVDSEVIESAKKLNLNISEITEKILRGFAFEPKGGDTQELYEKYAALFDVIVPLLKKYDIWTRIGRHTLYDDAGEPMTEAIYQLGPEGEFYDDEGSKIFDEIRQIDLYAFDRPNEILKNLVKEMARTAENNKQRLRELELARRIIEAISSSDSLHEKTKATPASEGKRVQHDG